MGAIWTLGYRPIISHVNLWISTQHYMIKKILFFVFLILQVSNNNLITYLPHTFSHGLATSVLGLKLYISSDHFSHDGSMKVRCIASVAPLLWQGDKESVLQKFDKREALLLGEFKNTILVDLAHFFPNSDYYYEGLNICFKINVNPRWLCTNKIVIPKKWWSTK